MANIPLDKTMVTGCLVRPREVMLAESLDYAVSNDIEISFVSRYDPLALPSDPWRARPYENWTVVSTAYASALDTRCILSREGQVRLYGPGGSPDKTYQIDDAGVMREGHSGFGYVNRIRAIGNGLYVCGMARQVYRFEPGITDPLAGQWVDFAGAMRQAPTDEPPADAGEAFEQWLDENETVDMVDIAGSSESDIYCVGEEAWHWSGSAWSRLALPTDEFLEAIKVVSEREVYLVGRNGTLLLGNARDGFVDLSSVDDNQRFIGIELFDGKIHLATSSGLFVHDRERQKILPYQTGLRPELRDAHVLEAKDGVLWSIGFKDLACFDGTTWTRVQHPDNPPIR